MTPLPPAAHSYWEKTMGSRRYFSERRGFKPPKTTIQLDGMDRDLRVALWNAVCETFGRNTLYETWLSNDRDPGRVLRLVWILYFKQPIDEFPQTWLKWEDILKRYILEYPWHEVYDIIEFILEQWETKYELEEFSHIFNYFLERELSGYRIINGMFTPITDEIESAEIEQALDVNNVIRPVRLQLEKALRKLSNRDEPDYRGSIRDTIGAVETLCRLISDESELEVGKALRAIERTGKVKIHDTLRDGLISLYGWKKDDQGVKHGLMDESNLTFNDAKYMLVSCSAFINYLIALVAEAGLKLGFSS
jgi:hypothetical protein